MPPASKPSQENEDASFSREDRRLLPELREILILADRLKDLARVETLATISHGNVSFPLIAIEFGPRDPATPVLALFGGVHGLERIGTRVLIAYLRTVMELQRWDRNTQGMLERTRLLFLPLINPVGMFLKQRSNGNGVDLMRNAPVEATGVRTRHIYAGHRYSPRLPWYRGAEGAPMELEAKTVCDFVRQRIFPSKQAISVDVHSGYGKVDRFWFPYAKSQEPFPNVAEVMAVKNLLDQTYPNHVYRIEPQSREYITHGDLWDYLYDEYRATNPQGKFLPFSLELGSWMWVKKNWTQVFSLLGVFNPRLPHRIQRTLRRHVPLLDFLYRVSHSSEVWADMNVQKRERLEREGKELWYG